MDISGDALTTGQLLNITSTSTALTTGSLGVFDWSPSSWATASGDLVQIDLGQYGDVTGDLFSIEDNGSDIFTVDTAQIESAVPHAFTAVGDVSLAYDLVFTNQTASGIESYGPLTIESGESFENNNLTLKTYGTGDIVFDNDGTTTALLSDEGKLILGDSTPVGMLTVDTTNTATFGKAAVIIDHDESQDILSASVSGTTRLTLTTGGQLELLTDGTSAGLEIGAGGDLDLYHNSGNSFIANATGDLNIDGVASSGIVFNSTGADIDFTVQGDTDTSLIFGDASTDHVGIGQGTPLYKLHVTDSDISTASAFIENTADVGDNNVIGMIIKLGADADSPAAGDRFINFMRGDSLVVGKIFGDGDDTITYGANGVDFAEYIQKADSSESLTKGNLLCISSDGVTKCSNSEKNIVGAVSTSPIVAGGVEHENDPGYVLAGLIGQIFIDVTDENGVVSKGDPVTVSNTQAGRGARSTSTGRIVGYALENANGNDQILVYVNPGWHDPTLQFADTGELEIVASSTQQVEGEIPHTTYSLLHTTGEAIDRVGVFSDFIAANVKAGLVEVNEIVTDSISGQSAEFVNFITDNLQSGVAQIAGLVSPEIKTQEISPIEGEKDVAITIGDDNQSEFGKLLVQNPSGETVVEIDETGKIKSAEIESESASISGELRANKIYANEIIAESGAFADLASETISTITREEIEKLLVEAEVDRGLLDQANSWETNTATGSALLNELAVTDLFVTGTAALEA
jgi:hypothetical protein